MSETANPPPAKSRVPWRGVLVLGCLLFAFASSFYSWTHNSHERQLRQRFPTWYRDGYVLFDGYGNYTEQIRNVILDPQKYRASFQHYVGVYIHANTPLYPLLCAVVSLTGLSIVWASFAVNLAASVLCVFVFYQLVRQRAAIFGWPELLTFLTFLLHCSLLSGFARPLPDMMSMAVLLAFFWTCRRYYVTSQRRWLGLAAALCVVGILTKTILYLQVPLFFLVLLRGMVPDILRPTRRQLLTGIACGVTAALVLAVAVFVLRNTASMRFVLGVSRNAFAAWLNADDRHVVIRGGAAFFALALGLFPVVVAVGWRRGLAREELEHVAWLVMYAGQRLLFAGFNLGYGRARYGIPVVASLAILCLPGYRKLWESPRWRWFAPVPILLQVAIWTYFLYRLSSVPKGIRVNIGVPG
jgi:hypothetical protein